MKSLKTIINEARPKDNHRWNANDEIATMNFIYKDFKKELGRDPGKPYMDDDQLVVGSDTVLNVKDNTSIGDMKAAVAAWIGKNTKPEKGEAKVGRFNVKLPDELAGTILWTHEIQGGGVPVVAGGKVYQFGYYGSGEQVEESLTCLDLKSGELIWDQRRQDFISDIVYDRYGVGSACVDPQSGNVYFQTSAGELLAYATDGSLLWERSLMEEFSRLTFPNGRTGGPCVDEGLVILHAITANWGTNGPARDRFYAFDKENGDLVWISTPGTTPKDSSFAPLVFENLEDGQIVTDLHKKENRQESTPSS